jgi:hypothetical protein
VPASASHINVETQLEDSSSIYAYYRALIEARHRVSALTTGSFERIDAGDPAMFVYQRSYEGSAVLVAVNLSGRAIIPSGALVDEAFPSSRWNLYLGNMPGPHPDTEQETLNPAPASSMAPWEARVYLAAR